MKTRPALIPTAPECREPISLVLAVLATAGAAEGAAAGAGLAFALTWGQLTSALLIGGSIAAQALMRPKPPQDEIPNADTAATAEVRINRRQPVPAKRVIYGRALTGGDLFFERASQPFLYHGWLVASREVHGFEEIRIGTDRLAFYRPGDVLFEAQALVPFGHLDANGQIATTPDYEHNLVVTVRHGKPNQLIDPLLQFGYPALPYNFRQRGIATATLQYRWPGSTYDDRQAMWGDAQAPNPLFLVKGCKVYDPRDPSQFRDNPTTWKWSNTAALCQADYLRADYGGRIDPDDIDWQAVTDAANYDDELVGTNTAGEFITRHTIDGVVTLNQAPVDVITGMLTANRGFVCERGGFVWIASARPKTPILTITDGMLAGGIEFQAAKAKRDLLNRVRSRFVADEREYEQSDGPLLDRTDLQATDGEILSATLGLPFTRDHRRVQRLQKQFLETTRLGKACTVRVATSVLDLVDAELVSAAVKIESELFPWANGTYRVDQQSFLEGYSSLELKLAEYDAAIERNWKPAIDEKPFVIADLG